MAFSVYFNTDNVNQDSLINCLLKPNCEGCIWSLLTVMLRSW